MPRSMRLLLDARPLQGPTGARGVGGYVRALANGLLLSEPALELVLLFDPRAGELLAAPTGPRVHLLAAGGPPGPAIVWGRLLGPRWLRRGQARLWHATFLAAPRVPAGMPWVATIHDLIPLRHPRRFTRRQRIVFSRSLRWACAAPRVIAVSHATASQLDRELGVDPRRVVVIPPPLEAELYEAAPDRGIEGLDGPYVIHLGGFDPLKGVVTRLLPAFAELAQEQAGLRLVLTGGTRAAQAPARAFVEQHRLHDKVLFTGQLEAPARRAAIAGAAVVAVSSDEEGFGLPAAEALALGVPLAVGPARATRKLAGNLAALSTDDSAPGFARALRQALASGGPDSPEGSARRRHARQFSPAEVARRMLALYSAVIEEAGA
ncbi:MAG: glycosyltransferase family 4 protein [Acidobacteriota bacterium]|nr:MAG: glycosyltransferase family 4 protein [Acidobacteriota bacterium]